MSSINWEKIKTRAYLIALMRHNDKVLREKNKHSNKNIDKSLTHNNSQLYDFDGCEKRFKDRLEKLDRQPHANKRKDRVIACSLEYPVPAGFETLEPAQQNEWLEMSLSCMTALAGGEDNIIGWWVHKDEVHDYIAPTGKVTTSRQHVHFMFVPEVNGKLNAKKICNRKNIIKANNMLEDVSQRYGLKYLKGEGRYYGIPLDEIDDTPHEKRSPAYSEASVEQLKWESKMKLDEVIQAQKITITEQDAKINEQKAQIQTNEKHLKAIQELDKPFDQTLAYRRFKKDIDKVGYTTNDITRKLKTSKIPDNLKALLDLQVLVNTMHKNKDYDRHERLDNVFKEKSEDFYL